MAQHRHQRHDARAAGDEQQGLLWSVRVPDEVAAHRSAQLEAVTRDDLVDEIGRDLAVVEALDGQRRRLVRRGRDRVASLGLVAVLRRKAHVDVLSGAVSGPAVDVEDERSDARRLGHRVGDLRDEPGQSPQ